MAKRELFWNKIHTVIWSSCTSVSMLSSNLLQSTERRHGFASKQIVLNTTLRQLGSLEFELCISFHCNIESSHQKVQLIHTALAGYQILLLQLETVSKLMNHFLQDTLVQAQRKAN